MSTNDYNLNYTDGYANSKKINEKEIKIEGDCKITNYDPREENGTKRGQITIDLINGEQVILDGNGKGHSKDVKADFSNKKFSIFNNIASLDGDSEVLSVNDIRKLDKSLINKWKLKDLRFDYKNGVATLVWGDNDILRIDFSNKEKTIISTEKSIDVDKNTQTEDIETNKPTQTNVNNQVACTISKFTGGFIDIDDVYNLETVAKYTGISEKYIKDILIGLEGKKQWPLCSAEYDNVPKKGYPKGFLTIGFGHTSLAGEPKVTEGLTISEKQAYQIMANDIVNAVKLSRNKLRNKGLSYDDIPKSIQNAIVDLVFNKGPSEINESLIANIRAGYYGSAARRTWFETPNVGLQKRNMYRFIAALDSLENDEKINAIKRFKSEHTNHLKNVFTKDINAKFAWNTMCENIFYDDGKF